MDRQYRKTSDIDKENILKVHSNDCTVTVYFTKQRKKKKKKIVLESLLDTFEKRINNQIKTI